MVRGYRASQAPKLIEFDIAVAARSTGVAGGGLKVAVFGIGANAEGKQESESVTVSRIRFSVPMAFKRTQESEPGDYFEA